MKQGARRLGLRAAMSLVRALDARMDSDDGAALHLRQIYESLTEGFATPDLKEAKTLLDGLR